MQQKVFLAKLQRDLVRVEVTMAGNREPLRAAITRGRGRISVLPWNGCARRTTFASRFGAAVREGERSAYATLRLPSGSAERIAQADPDLFMRIEELDLPATTKIELNTAADAQSPTWQTLEELSTGQKATAVLLLLLLESRSSSCCGSARGRSRQPFYYRERGADHAAGKNGIVNSFFPPTTRTFPSLGTQS